MSTCGGPRRRANMWVATSLVSATPRNLHFHSRPLLAYSKQIKMSAGLLFALVVYACFLYVVETRENGVLPCISFQLHIQQHNVGW